MANLLCAIVNSYIWDDYPLTNTHNIISYCMNQLTILPTIFMVISIS